MEAKELMINDLVWYVDEPVKIKHNYGKTLRYDDGKYSHEVEQSYIKPIPLTEEILKANGYSKFFYGDEAISFQIGYHYNNLRESELIKNQGEDFFVTCMGLGRLEFHYVHELQHALRLCGLRELADNLQIRHD